MNPHIFPPSCSHVQARTASEAIANTEASHPPRSNEPTVRCTQETPAHAVEVSQTTIFRPRQRKLVVVFRHCIKTKHKIGRNIAHRQSIAARPVRPSGVQQRGLNKAAERPSPGSRKTAGRLSAGSVTAAAVRKEKERKVEFEAWSALTVALLHM